MDKSKIILAVQQEKMSSLEVAKLTGMRHDHLLSAIRKMEKDWEQYIEEEKDAVVVNTADLHNMQAELNLVWDHILPALK